MTEQPYQRHMRHFLQQVINNSRYGKIGKQRAMRTIEEIQTEIDATRRAHSDCDSPERRAVLAVQFNELLVERENAEQYVRNNLPVGDHFAPIMEAAGGLLLDTFSSMSTEEKLENLNGRLMHIEGFLSVFSKNEFSPLDNIISSAMIQEFQNGSGFEQDENK